MTNKKTETPKEHDINASLEDRTAALLDKNFGDGNTAAEIPQAHMDLYAVANAAPQAMPQNFLPQIHSAPVSEAIGEPLIPSLLDIFNGKENLVHQMQGTVGLLQNIDMGQEPKEVKIIRKQEPESLYFEKPDKKLLNLLVYFVFGHFGDEGKKIFDQLWKAKNNMNTELVSLIRQRFWDALSRRQFKKMQITETLQDRTAIGNNLRDIDNARLLALLGENVFQELCDLAELLNMSNKTCFGECIRFALGEADLIEQEPKRAWTP